MADSPDPRLYKDLEGIARNAQCAGTKNGETAWITYYIETDNGEIIHPH